MESVTDTRSAGQYTGQRKSSAKHFNTNGGSFANAATRGVTRKRQRR